MRVLLKCRGSVRDAVQRLLCVSARISPQTVVQDPQDVGPGGHAGRVAGRAGYQRHAAAASEVADVDGIVVDDQDAAQDARIAAVESFPEEDAFSRW